MLITLRQMTGSALYANDGVVGEVCDLYFDPSDWSLSHVMVEAGGWSERRQVVLPREALESVRCETSAVSIGLSVREILEAPKVDPAEPVSFSEQAILRRYFRGLPAARRELRAGYPRAKAATSGSSLPVEQSRAGLELKERSPFRSAVGCINYQIAAADGAFGRVDDLLLDSVDWRIRFIVVDPESQRPNDRIVITPDWVSEVDSEAGTVAVDQTRDAIKECPQLENSILPSFGGPFYQTLSTPQRSDWDEDVVAGAPMLDQIRSRNFDRLR